MNLDEHEGFHLMYEGLNLARTFLLKRLDVRYSVLRKVMENRVLDEDEAFKQARTDFIEIANTISDLNHVQLTLQSTDGEQNGS